jgi:glycosyltransferase involved in cell wall biosynthesis
MTIFSTAAVEKIKSFDDKTFAFGVMRNERLRVEAWIDHYRAMGIRRLFVVDNGSDDGTYEYLLAQPDVVTERTQQSFRDSNYGIDWLNEFRQIAGPEKWILFADADELMIYEGWPEVPVTEFTERVEGSGSNAVFGFMLDMYPDGPLDSCASAWSGNLFAAAPCFDSDYVFEFSWTPAAINYISVIGGPRVRLLSTIERETSLTRIDIVLRLLTARVAGLAPAVLTPAIVRYLPRWRQELMKTPLARGGMDFHYLGNHFGTGAR